MTCDHRGHHRERLPQRAAADRDDDVMIAVQRTCLSQRNLLCAPALGTVYGHQHASSPMRHDVRCQPRVSVTFRVTGFASGAENGAGPSARDKAALFRVGNQVSLPNVRDKRREPVQCPRIEYRLSDRSKDFSPSFLELPNAFRMLGAKNPGRLAAKSSVAHGVPPITLSLLSHHKHNPSRVLRVHPPAPAARARRLAARAARSAASGSPECA